MFILKISILFFVFFNQILFVIILKVITYIKNIYFQFNRTGSRFIY